MRDEKRLIRKIQRSGDLMSADTLVRRYYDEIFRYLSRQLHDKTNAMDVTQEVFVSMLKTIQHYDAGKAGFRTWLYRIATNKAIDFFRSNARRQNQLIVLDDPDLFDSLASTYDIDILNRLGKEELAHKVCRYIDSLPVNIQQVFRLKFYGECNFAHIAEILSVPQATVKTRYYRLLKVLKKEFEDEFM